MDLPCPRRVSTVARLLQKLLSNVSTSWWTTGLAMSMGSLDRVREGTCGSTTCVCVTRDGMQMRSDMWIHELVRIEWTGDE